MLAKQCIGQCLAGVIIYDIAEPEFLSILHDMLKNIVFPSSLPAAVPTSANACVFHPIRFRAGASHSSIFTASGTALSLCPRIIPGRRIPRICSKGLQTPRKTQEFNLPIRLSGVIRIKQTLTLSVTDWSEKCRPHVSAIRIFLLCR